MKDNTRLVVVSNRVPPSSEVSSQEGRSGPVGGLVSAVKPAMEQRGGLWFGWSGKSTQRRPDATPAVSRFGPVELATLDLSEDEVSLFYTGFANRTLWPLLHSFPERVIIRHDTYRAYRRINRRFAEALYPMLGEGDLVWIHDFHLFNVGEELRQMGWRGKLGFFLHVPFPATDIFTILPWSRQILEGLLHYDLVGVHTDRYRRNLVDVLESEVGGEMSGGVFTHQNQSVRLGVYHIGIDLSIFEKPDRSETEALAEQLSIPLSAEHQMILAVDRLDYTKGIPERLRAIERLLDHYPSLTGKVSYVQISSPSRTRVPEYVREKEQVDQLVGRINGRFSEAGWVPIRYLYRSYPQKELACFYSIADVCMVTPLRDGMNLVAKEFVASQGEKPGVLVLSKFSGAASSMTDALVVNPYDVDGMAEATYRALNMPDSERRLRWKALMDVVCNHTARSWSDAFQLDLINS